jgi:hypothetical protein
MCVFVVVFSCYAMGPIYACDPGSSLKLESCKCVASVSVEI